MRVKLLVNNEKLEREKFLQELNELLFKSFDPKHLSTCLEDLLQKNIPLETFNTKLNSILNDSENNQMIQNLKKKFNREQGRLGSQIKLTSFQ